MNEQKDLHDIKEGDVVCMEEYSLAFTGMMINGEDRVIIHASGRTLVLESAEGFGNYHVARVLNVFEPENVKDRVILEKEELDKKISALRDFLKLAKVKVHDEPIRSLEDLLTMMDGELEKLIGRDMINLLGEQLLTMESYSDVLGRRIKLM